MKRSVLNRLYDRVIEGLPIVGTPIERARSRRKAGVAAVDTAERLTGYYTSMCGATGFVCGLPGYITMPVTVPSNLAGVAMLQLHLCATVAHLAGEDIHDEAVRRKCVKCLLASDTRADADDDSPDESKGVATRVATKLLERGLRFSGEQASRVIRRGGARSMPILGGLIGGYSDAASTISVSRRAREAFFASDIHQD